MNNTSAKRILFSFTFILIIIFWGFVFFSVLKTSMPSNSLGEMFYGNSKIIFRSFLPEGFAFFTRSPREFKLTLYSKDKKEVDCIMHRSSIGLVLKRYPRALI